MGKTIQFLGHPLHPVFVHLPMALLPTSFLADLLALWWRDPFWSRFAFYTLILGLIAGTPALVTGLLDLAAIPEQEKQAQKTGNRHMMVMLIALCFFLLSWLARIIPVFASAGEPGIPLAMSGLGFGMLLWGGWLGGELVYRLGVGRSL